jgi:putative tryptophan/tyrosine transport system substrate-binding protein
MRRREFIAGISAAAWPLAARAQQRTPVVGVLSTATPEMSRLLVLSAAFRQALKETGFVEGQNVTVEYPDPSQRLREVLSESRMREICTSGSLSGMCLEALPALAADLVGRPVDLIYIGGLQGGHCGKSIDRNRPDCLHHGGGPRQRRHRRKPQSPGRKRDWLRRFRQSTNGETA